MGNACQAGRHAICKDGHLPVSTSRSRSTGRTGICMRAMRFLLPPIYYLLSRFTRNSGIWNADTPMYTSVPSICAFCPEVLTAREAIHSGLDVPHSALARRFARRGQRICALSPVRMMTVNGSLDSAKIGHVSVGTGFPPWPFLPRGNRSVFLTSDSVWFTLSPRLNITTLLPSTHLHDVSRSDPGNWTDGPAILLSHCWLTPICDAPSSQFREERIPEACFQPLAGRR